MQYNARKRQALAVFAAAYPAGLRPTDYAWRAHQLPATTAYSYLARLWRWGLLERRDHPVRYRITARGRERLAWLRRRG